jgi:hypothetical protein
MMNDETLMAYADGELAEPERSAVERALAADAALAARVDALRVQRRRVQAAFEPLLDEPVPPALQRLLQPPPAVVDLGRVRAERAQRRAWGWQAWGGIAAGLVVGLLVGQRLGTEEAPAAAGAIEQALSQQLGSDVDGPLRVALSYVDDQGRYCRAFSTRDGAAGLACRQGGGWALQALAAAPAASAGELRQAASALPPALLQAVDAHIRGTPLDADAERRARDAGWRR